MASRGAETSLLTGGITFHLHFENGSKIEDKCFGLFSCSQELCEIQKLNTTYISLYVNQPNNTNCQIQGLTWLIKWIHVKCCLIFLIFASFIFIIGIIVVKIKRLVGCICLVLAATLLSVAYIFEFVWMVHYTEVYYDQQPQVVEIWNIVMPFMLIMGLIISYFPLLIKNKYDERLG